MQLQLDMAAAKVSKYASRESGDTVEIVERPHGGFSVVVADGQRSGRSAKLISNLVSRKAIALLAEGVRDGAVARATHDYLATHRGGQVSCELTIASVDLVTQTLVLSRNARCPSLLRRGDEFVWLDTPAEAIGIHRNTKPAIAEIPLAVYHTLFVITDGVWSAGAVTGSVIDLPEIICRTDPAHSAPAATLAAAILDRALCLDNSRPRDDATVVVLKIAVRAETDGVRRMQVEIPL